MIKLRKFIWFFYIVFFIHYLDAQSLLKQKPKSIFWGLIKIDTESKYEDGYWYDKWFRSREFTSPITYMPVEIRYGLGINGKITGSASSPDVGDLDNWIWYEEDVKQLNQEAKNVGGVALDIDFGMINIPNMVMNTSWMNFLTGINYRSSSIFIPKSIPDDWKEGTNLIDKEIQFKPELKEFLITNSLHWQPFNWWYLNLRYGYGLASAKFYFDNDLGTINKSPSGTGTSMALGLGIRFIIDPGKLNRFSIGIDIRHSYTKINNINDSNNLTPITRFDLANYGIYFTLSTFYGGKNTVGDDAKRIYYNKDYLLAKSKFIEFVTNYPNHSNRYRARYYIEKCNKKIPYQIMDQGLVLDDKGETEAALKKYLEAKSKVVLNDSLILESLDFRIEEIAKMWMNSAELLLEKGFYIDALNLVKKVAKFSEIGENRIDRFKSYVIMNQGKKLQSILIFGKAMGKSTLALELNKDLESKVKALYYKAGVQLVELANEVDEFDEILLAVNALEEAKLYSSSIGNSNEKLLKDLKEKLAKLDNYKMSLLGKKEMSRARYIQAIARSPKLTIGMTLPLIQELLGDPHEIVRNNNDPLINEEMWIYYLKQKQLQLSFKDFILFKIESG